MAMEHEGLVAAIREGEGCRLGDMAGSLWLEHHPNDDPLVTLKVKRTWQDQEGPHLQGEY